MICGGGGWASRTAVIEFAMALVWAAISLRIAHATLQSVKLKSEKAEPTDHDYRDDAHDPTRAVNRTPQPLQPRIDRCPPTQPCGRRRRHPISTICACHPGISVGFDAIELLAERIDLLAEHLNRDITHGLRL